MSDDKFEHCYLKAKSGWLKLTADSEALLAIESIDQPQPGAPIITYPHLKEAYKQIAEYIGGSRVRFRLKVKPSGMEFRNDVSRALEGLGLEEALHDACVPTSANRTQ